MKLVAVAVAFGLLVAGGALAAPPGAVPGTAPPKTYRTLLVGPNRDLKRPSDAARIAQTGDRIEIDAGEYRDCAVWRADRLRIRAVGGYAHIRDNVCQKKGIWVVAGNNMRIRRIEFSGAAVEHRNGAGVRLEGRNFRVMNSYFHDNENGILAAKNPRSRISIRNTVFERNGRCKPDCGQGIDIGHVARLVVTGSKFVGQQVGNHIRSRARITRIVGNRIRDGLAGTASHSINIPNGGTVEIRMNLIQQGQKSQNHPAIISIGKAGVAHPGDGILIERNVFENSYGGPSVFVRNHSKQPATLRANRFNGQGNLLEGPGTVE